MLFRKKRKKAEKEFLKYSFINNSILLTTKTIEKNGFYEIYRQENNEHSIQILCFNPDTEEYQAFDRFHWMDEPRVVTHLYPSWGYDEKGCFIHSENWMEPEGVYYNEDLWTPIKLHFTVAWFKKHIC